VYPHSRAESKVIRDSMLALSMKEYSFTVRRVDQVWDALIQRG
jgi:hypothetical protein